MHNKDINVSRKLPELSLRQLFLCLCVVWCLSFSLCQFRCLGIFFNVFGFLIDHPFLCVRVVSVASFFLYQSCFLVIYISICVSFLAYDFLCTSTVSCVSFALYIDRFYLIIFISAPYSRFLGIFFSVYGSFH